MPSRDGITLLLIGLAFIVGVLALVSPWWTITSVPQEDEKGVQQVGPFDSGDGVIATESARISGAIVVMGLVALGASIALLGVGLGTKRSTAIQNVPLVALAGVALLGLALILVVFVYPADYEPARSFWGGDVGTGEPTGFTRAAAAYGWYLGVAAVTLASAGVVLGLMPRRAARMEGPAGSPDQI